MAISRARLYSRGKGRRIRVRYEGEFSTLSSFGVVAREMALSMCSRREIDLHLVDCGAKDFELSEDPKARVLRSFLSESQSDEVDFHIRHQWPPNFEPPTSGRWVLAQPWEYGSLPQNWVDAFRDSVDDVWCFSRYVQGSYLRAGFDPFRTAVIPHGIDPDVFRPDVDSLPLTTKKTFKILYLGGTLHRKGADIALEAYLRAFSSCDDVTLVVKDMGTNTFYRGQTIGEKIIDAARDPTRPEILYLDRHFQEGELVRLYNACDVLLAPYRGEGFALPVLEAMACGLHVIVTSGGATDDYVDGSCGTRIPSDKSISTDRLRDGTKCVAPIFLRVADVHEVVRSLRWAYDYRHLGAELGQVATKRARHEWTWDQGVDRAIVRFEELLQRGVRRLEAQTTSHPTHEPRREVAPEKDAAPSEVSPFVPSTTSRSSSVSLTMIVRNEEKNLGECLESIQGVVDEIVVVDTGSTDRTKDIAREFGAKLYDFPWVDSFSRARNEAIERATGDWVFWLDADDRVTQSNREKLKQLFSELPQDTLTAYSMKVECVPLPGGSPTVVDHVRLFPRRDDLRWEYRVHENILPAINRAGGQVKWTDVAIHHYGYLDAELRRSKRMRDHALLLKDLEERAEDAFVHFNVGHSYLENEDYAKAISHLEESISRSEPHYSQVKKAYVLLAQAKNSSGRTKEALETLDEGRKHHPRNPELLYYRGVYSHVDGDLARAAECFQEILETNEWPQEFGSYDVGILDHKSRHRLAHVYLDQGREKDGEALLAEIVKTHPSYVSGMMDLCQHWIKTGRADGAQKCIETLKSRGCDREWRFLTGLVKEAQGDLGGAARSFKQALSYAPDSEEYVAKLAHVCLKQGDLSAAEHFLRRHVELNGRSPEAQYNLAGVLYGKGDKSAALEALERALSLRPDYAFALELKEKLSQEESMSSN